MKKATGAKVGVGVGLGVYAALVAVNAWTMRKLNQATITVDDGFNEDDFVDVHRPVGEDERQLDPNVLQWMREQPCGVVVDVVTGVVRREPQLPMLTIALDTSELDWEALQEFHAARQAAEVAERQPSNAPMPASLVAIGQELFGPNGPFAGFMSAAPPDAERDGDDKPQDVENADDGDSETPGGSEISQVDVEAVPDDAPGTELSDEKRD